MVIDDCLFYHILHECCINKYNPTGKCRDIDCPEKNPELCNKGNEKTGYKLGMTKERLQKKRKGNSKKKRIQKSLI